MDRFDFREQRLKGDAVVAFLLGVLVSYVLARFLLIGLHGRPGATIFNMLILSGVGGFWYWWRRVL